MLQRLKQDLKNDLIAGLLVVIPLATTIWLSITIAKWGINFMTRIPQQINPFDDLNPLDPTSGWYAIVPEDEVITLDISIEEAFKVLISGGIVNDNGNSSKKFTVNGAMTESSPEN